MQTFLPYPDFERSMRILDYRRLGKQRLEAKAMHDLLTGKADNNWKHHPATKMWSGCAGALAYYYNTCVTEWIRRGYKNTMPLLPVPEDLTLPWWWGMENFHRAHRARLIEKKEDFYLPLFPTDKGYNEAKYFWPDNTTHTFRVI